MSFPIYTPAVTHHYSSGPMQDKWPRFWHPLSQRWTLAGAELAVVPVFRRQQAQTTSASESSAPVSQGPRPSAPLSDRNTAPRSLALPSANWKKAVSTQLSDIVAAAGSRGSKPTKRDRKRATLPSPSMGHILFTLNFIWSLGTVSNTKRRHSEAFRLGSHCFEVHLFLWSMVYGPFKVINWIWFMRQS